MINPFGQDGKAGESAEYKCLACMGSLLLSRRGAAEEVGRDGTRLKPGFGIS
jgi:hypothetical protein